MFHFLNRKSKAAFVKNILNVFDDKKIHSPFLVYPNTNIKSNIDVGYRVYRLQEILNNFPYRFNDLSATEKEKLIQGTLYKKWVHEASGLLVPNPYEEITKLLLRHHVIDSHSELIDWEKVLQPQLFAVLSEEKDIRFLINHDFLSLWINYHTVDGLKSNAVQALTMFPEYIDYECKNKNTLFHGLIKKCYGYKNSDPLNIEFVELLHKRFEQEDNENDITECVQSLLTAKPNVNIPNDQGNTPLISLLKNFRNYEHPSFSKVIQLLISAGADVNHQNAAGKTPISYIMPVLLREQTQFEQFMYSDRFYDRDLRNYMEARNKKIKENLVHITTALIDGGADINVQDAKGNTPLMLFVQLIRQDKTVDKLSREILLSMLKKADVNLKNANGETPLFIAVGGCNTEVIKALLESGADINDVRIYQYQLYEKRLDSFKNNVIKDVNKTLSRLPIEYQKTFVKKLKVDSVEPIAKLIVSKKNELKLKGNELTRED